MKKKMIDDDCFGSIKSLIVVLQYFDEATRLLSETSANLHTADLALQILTENLSNYKDIQKRTIERIVERRCVWSDIILYLKNDHTGITLYNEPSYHVIEQLYNNVILLFLI